MQRPLYRSIADRIETRIVMGNYAAGAPLPTEAGLEREFGVSRITIRQALSLLKRRGLLYSRSGAGTRVRAPAHKAASMQMSGSLYDLTYYAAETRYRPVDRKLVPPPFETAKTLGVAAGEVVLRFRGIRNREETGDFAFEDIYVPEALGRTLDNALLGNRTLFSLLEEANGLSITEARQVITAVAAPASVSRWLGIPRRAPMLRTTRTYRIADGRAVEVAVSYFDVANFEYVMTLFEE